MEDRPQLATPRHPPQQAGKVEEHGECKSPTRGNPRKAGLSTGGPAISADAPRSQALGNQMHTNSATQKRTSTSAQDPSQLKQQAQEVSSPREVASERKIEKSETHRPLAGAPAQRAFSPSPSHVRAPPGEAHGPLQWGANTARTTAEAENENAREEEDLLCIPQPARSSPTVGARCRSRSSPSSSNDVCARSTLATSGTWSYLDEPDSNQQCDLHTHISCRSHRQNLPPSPCTASCGTDERQEDTSPKDASPPEANAPVSVRPGACRAARLLNASGWSKQARSKTLQIPHPQDNTTTAERNQTNPDARATPQTQEESPLGQCESEASPDRLCVQSTPTCKDEDLGGHAPFLSMGRPQETHLDTRERGSPRKWEPSCKTWKKWLGPEDGESLWKTRRRRWVEMESEEDSDEETMADSEAAAEWDSSVEEETAETDRQQSRRPTTQQMEGEEQDLKMEQGRERRTQHPRLLNLRAALASWTKSPLQQDRYASSSPERQPSPAAVLKNKDPPKVSADTQQAADYHRLAFLQLSIRGKPVVALLDTGCTHILISSNLPDELQLQGTALPSPTRLLLGNGDDMFMTEMIEDVKCKAGELYFRINAVLASIPFDLILGQPFLNKERLLWCCGPPRLTGWRGGRRLVLPISEAGPKEQTTAQEDARMWKDREEIKAAHEQLEKVLRDKGKEEAEAMVRPSPKQYKNFRTAASRAHAKKLAILAREQAEGNLNLCIWSSGNVVKGVNVAAGSPKARGATPGGGPFAPQPRDATACAPPQPSTTAPESKFLVVPKELSFQAQTNFVSTYEKFDTLAIQLELKECDKSMDKVKNIVHWPEKLENVTQVLQFLGLVGYVRMFMGTRFADMAESLIELTKKGVAFVWETEHTQAIQMRKRRLVNYTLLQLPDPSKPYGLWTDASVRSLGALLLQDGKPLGFLSKRMNKQQQPYFQLELLAPLTALKKWEHLLRPAEFPGLTVTYKPGKENIVADALSRNPRHQQSAASSPASYTPAIAAPAISATVQARATRNPLADPLLYELDPTTYDNPPERGPDQQVPTIAKSSVFPQRAPDPIPSDVRPATADLTDQQQTTHSSPQSPESLRAIPDAGGLQDCSTDNAAMQPRSTVHVHRLSHDQQDSEDTSAGVAVADDHPQLPKDTHLFLPPALNGLWGDASVRAVADAADLQHAALGPGLSPGTASWVAALPACPTHAEVFLAAEQQSPAHVYVAAKSPEPDTTYPSRIYRLRNDVLHVYISGGWRIVVPNQLSTRIDLLYRYHDHPTAGHMGFNKTYQQLASLYDWEGFKAFVKRYVATCVRCQMSKAVCQKPAALLHSLAIPAKQWDSVSMDFITGPPLSNKGNDAVMVVVDRLSKMAHFIPLPVTSTAADVASLFIREVVRLHGIHSSLVTDRDRRFLSEFSKNFTAKLDIQRCLSTAFHPQTDGQTERINQTLERLLRCFIQLDQSKWEQFLQPWN
ncbi:hypothetical protein Emed_006049 [Eimeria media]